MPVISEEMRAVDQKWRMTCLMDCYASMLNEHQRHICALYFDEDLSLSEIAEQEGSSRQAVHAALQRARRQLEIFESGFGLWERERTLIRRVKDIAQALDQPDAAAARNQARDLVRRLLTDLTQRGDEDGL